MTTSQKTIITVLLAAIIVLGFLIYNQSKAPLTLPDGENNTTNNLTPENSKPVSNTLPPAPNVAELLEENPGSGANTAQLTTWSAKVSSYAVNTSAVEVTACAPSPAVARVSLNQPITFKNTDSVAHTLVNGKITMTIPANSSKAITPNFAGPGIYGYSCDTKITGIFLVMP